MYAHVTFDALGTIPRYVMDKLLYWNTNLKEDEIRSWHQDFLKK